VNKRQLKKRKKIVQKRLRFFEFILVRLGRSNGKNLLGIAINKAIFSKRYAPFKYWVRLIGDLKKHKPKANQMRSIAPNPVYGGLKPSLVIYDEMHDYNPGQ
jgi:hypothetical protein